MRSWVRFKTQITDRTVDRDVLWETPGWLQVKMRPEDEDCPPGDTSHPISEDLQVCESVGRHCLNKRAPCEGCPDEDAVSSWGPLTFQRSPEELCP